MNPQQPVADAPKIDRDLIAQIIGEWEETARPFGKGEDYSEKDAEELGLPSPSVLNFLNKFVKKMIGTPFVPAWIATSPNPAGTMLACILRGRELGFKPMESLEVFWKAPDGRLAMWAKTMLALMRKSGFKFEWVSDDADGCEVRGVRPDGDTYVAHFTHEDALQAGLWDKNQSMHKKYPANMNRSRCITMMWNVLAADLGGGPMYSWEEVREELRNGPERGGAASSDAVFQDEAKRQTEAANPYNVGRKAPEATLAAPETEAKPEPAAPVAEPVKTESPSLDKTEPPKPVATTKPGAPPPSRSESVSEQAPMFAEPVASAPAVAPPAPVAESPKPELVKPAAPKPAAASDGKKTIKEILADLSELLPTVSPVTLQQKTFPEFLRGFLNVSDLKKVKREQAEPALAILPHLIRDYRAPLCQDPHSAGVLAGAGWNKLMRFFDDSWPDDCKVLATQIAIERYPDSGGSELMEFLQDPVHIEAMNAGEMRAFLAVLTKTRNALLLRDAADKWKKPMIDIFMGLDVDLQAATTVEVDVALKRVLAEGIDGAAAPEADESEAQDDDTSGMDDLFEDL
jgi:hypothetical protein